MVGVLFDVFCCFFGLQWCFFLVWLVCCLMFSVVFFGLQWCFFGVVGALFDVFCCFFGLQWCFFWCGWCVV